MHPYNFVLQPSTVPEAGIGVFALQPIPEGESLGLFLNDYASETIDYQTVPNELLAYCLNKGNGMVQCPKDFHHMGIENYINHSSEYNVRYDLERGFVALRNISEGEEIFANYAEIGDLHGVAKEDRELYVTE